MGLAIGTRANTVLKFWEASRAWYNRDDAAEGWTFEEIIGELRLLTKIAGPLEYQASALMGLVIEDQHSREPREGTLHQIRTNSIFDEYSMIPVGPMNFQAK